MSTSAPNALDVRPLRRARKRATVLTTFDRLEVGGSFILIDDQDPTDLCTCLDAERPDQSRCTVLRNGPYVWHVQVERRNPGP